MNSAISSRILLFYITNTFYIQQRQLLVTFLHVTQPPFLLHRPLCTGHPLYIVLANTLPRQCPTAFHGFICSLGGDWAPVPCPSQLFLEFWGLEVSLNYLPAHRLFTAVQLPCRDYTWQRSPIAHGAFSYRQFASPFPRVAWFERANSHCQLH